MVGKGFDLIQIFANRESIKLDGQVKMNQNSYNESVLWSVGTKPGKVGLWKEPWLNPVNQFLSSFKEGVELGWTRIRVHHQRQQHKHQHLYQRRR